MSGLQALVDCIHDDTRLSSIEGLSFGLGRLYLKQNARPPRVTWVPTSVAFASPDDVGARFVGTATSNTAIAIRLQTFQVHCHGCDLAQACALGDAVVAAIWKQAVGASVIGTGQYDTQTNTGADYAVDGEKLSFEVQFKVPVFEQATDEALTALTGQSHTGDFISNETGAVTTVC